MKKKIILIILTFITTIGCNKSKKEIYLFIDPTDEMIVKEEDRYYYIFYDKKIFNRFKKDINHNPDYKPNPNDIIDLSLYCLPLYTPRGETKLIDSKKLKMLDVVDRITYFKRLKIDEDLEPYFIEKVDTDSYSIKNVSPAICE